ncbi:MAG: Maf family nucleotide pyrophosphatase [Gammaproteobacteria bacterium]|nr:Maf family nucleotide pyrophosphatase [Gammaproteobacteria bacterium]
MKPEIILASSSPFRKSLLQRLHLDFECYSPDIDESPYPREKAAEYVSRLAQQKAEAVASIFPGAVVIGSDQCALINDELLGKPGSHENALQQLRKAQGETVVFHTGVCVLRPTTGFSEVDDILYEVDFRRLEDSQLEHYLLVEQPYQCAGSFKSEGYGICLFKQMRGDDPTALIGLPLIRLIHMLENAGVQVV